jgi:predicted aldo/keto reductase-like oxidoreductase
VSDAESNLKRRSFLKWGAAGLAGLCVKPGAAARSAGAVLPASAAGRRVVTRTLGRTGLRLPIVSLGVMNSNNPNLVQAALDKGIVLLDTSSDYQRGTNEVMIGEVVKDRPRDSYIIATKVVVLPTTAEYIENVEASLRRLNLDHVDILYVHAAGSRSDVLFEPVLKALDKLKKDGKTRFVGVSTHGHEPEVIRAAVEGRFHDVVLTAYNFRQDHGEDVRAAVAEAARAGLGVVAMKTLAGRYWDKQRTQPINTRAALKWVLNDPNVTTAIPGMTTFDQLEDDLSVMADLPLTDQERRDLRLNPSSSGLYCQQCGRCLPACREKLPLPALMRGYMYAFGYQNLGAAYDLVTKLDLPESPCLTCSTCDVRCVKGIDVADRVKDVVRLKVLPPDLFA